MKILFRRFFYILFVIRVIPHIILLFIHPSSVFLRKEKDVWIKTIKNENNYNLSNYLWILRLPEYRSVFYLRIGGLKKLISWLAPGQNNLYFRESSRYGAGFVIQHGHSSRIAPDSIGKNCQIWQNVTIGVDKPHMPHARPIIGDNVRIFTGAIVVGNITIGNNVTIGAGSVVVKNVPPNCTVVGNPAYIIRRNGNKVIESL